MVMEKSIMDDWIRIDDYKQLPVGEWYVIEEQRRGGYRQHVASVHLNDQGHKIAVVGSAFGFDRGTIVAYRAIHEMPEEFKNA